MNYAEICIIKRDGKREDFSISKIKNAIGKAFHASGIDNEDKLIAEITMRVISNFVSPTISVEEIQDLVEKELMKVRPEVAKKYIIYREWRNTERDRKTQMKHIMDGIVAIDKNDVNLSNANMSSHTPAGQMMTFASEVTKDYTYKYLLPKKYAEAHQLGDIHIHDLDYYPTKTTTCIQYDLDDLFERGFRTKNGSIRTPKASRVMLRWLLLFSRRIRMSSMADRQFLLSISSWQKVGQIFPQASGIVHQSMSPWKTEIRPMRNPSGTLIKEYLPSIKTTEAERETLRIALVALLIIDKEHLARIVEKAYQQTRKDTHQAMEGFIHNLNTMHSRGGNQVVFSSINYGTDTSAEGRMVIEELLKATIEGLGTRGEVPVFPIQIFKVKDGVSYSEKDFEKAMKAENIEEAMTDSYEAPNFDLLLKACQTTAKALFPNFMFLDTPFNKNEKWRADDPKRYIYELATMGCRTRVFENVAGEKSSLGRGNLSFTTLNMPRLAIEARIKAENLIEDERNKDAIEQKAKEIFIESVHQMSVLVADQLYERYQYQRTALARQFPFMMGNNVWKGGGELNPNEQVGDALRSGTLGIGFIGGHNAMVALYGQGHGHNQKAWDTLYEAVMEMNKVVNEYKEKYNLNYSVLATPAEGLSGRFTKMDRRKYGKIPGVTDRDYYVNSFHVDVKEPISIVEKIKREAPFHAITRGGHITYVELDGEAQKNVRAIAKIVKVMHDEGIGYGSINHPVDTCHNCGYKGVIFDKCPVCQSESILRMRRITGYLTGDLSS